MSSEVNEWKLKLESFKKAVEKGGQQECNSAVRTLQTEVCTCCTHVCVPRFHTYM